MTATTRRDEPAVAVGVDDYVARLLTEQGKWVEAQFETISVRFEELHRANTDLRSQSEKAGFAVIQDFENRMKADREAWTLLVAQRDKWVESKWAELDQRAAALFRTTEGLFLQRDKWLEGKFAAVQQRFEDDRQAVKLMMEQHKHAHQEFHEIHSVSLEEFKHSTRQRLEEVQKNVDQLKEERANFITRDHHTAEAASLNKQIDTLERQTRENLELAIKQLREAHDSKIDANMERLTRLEQSIQVMNARNQQSIIALGILLTLVEIIIRFYK